MKLIGAVSVAVFVSSISSNVFANGGQFITNLLSGKCIDVSGGPGVDTGATLQLADCELSGKYPGNDSPTDQKWIIKNGFIRNVLSGKCIDVNGGPGVDLTPLPLEK